MLHTNQQKACSIPRNSFTVCNSYCSCYTVVPFSLSKDAPATCYNTLLNCHLGIWDNTAAMYSKHLYPDNIAPHPVRKAYFRTCYTCLSSGMQPHILRSTARFPVCAARTHWIRHFNKTSDMALVIGFQTQYSPKFI